MPERLVLPDGRVIEIRQTVLADGRGGMTCRWEGQEQWEEPYADVRDAIAKLSGLSPDEAWQLLVTEFKAQARRQAQATGGQVYFSEGVQVRLQPTDQYPEDGPA